MWEATVRLLFCTAVPQQATVIVEPHFSLYSRCNPLLANHSKEVAYNKFNKHFMIRHFIKMKNCCLNVLLYYAHHHNHRLLSVLGIKLSYASIDHYTCTLTRKIFYMVPYVRHPSWQVLLWVFSCSQQLWKTSKQ